MLSVYFFGMLHRLGVVAGRLTACILSASVISAAADSVRPVVRLDLGPAGSAVENGFQRIPASQSYQTGRGYGWVSEGPREFDVPKPEANLAAGANRIQWMLSESARAGTSR